MDGRPTDRRRLRDGLVAAGASLALHAVGFVAALVGGWLATLWLAPSPVLPVIVVAHGTAPEPPSEEPEASARPPGATTMAASPPAGPPAPDAVRPIDAFAVPTETVDRMVDAAAERADGLDAEARRDRAEELARRLAARSRPEDVEDAVASVGSALHLPGRASEPDDAATGAFDTKTAQLHDVRRTDREGGGHDYVVVLLDAAGRTTEVALTEAEGREIYKTWKLIKANPLLERIYRGVVMGVLDRVLTKVDPVPAPAPSVPTASAPTPPAGDPPPADAGPALESAPEAAAPTP